MPYKLLVRKAKLIKKNVKLNFFLKSVVYILRKPFNHPLF